MKYHVPFNDETPSALSKEERSRLRELWGFVGSSADTKATRQERCQLERRMLAGRI